VGWNVFIDETTYLKYQRIPPGSLRELVQLQLIPEPVKPDGKSTTHFAKIQMDRDNACPLLSADKLCQIQKELGEEALSVTCATYPRIKHAIDKVEEKALSLSCPEAARLVLLTPALLHSHAKGQHVLTWNQPTWNQAGDELTSAREPLNRYFWPIREFVLGLLTNRQYELWQRLFLLGVFMKRLDAQARGELNCGFVALRRDFQAAVDSGTLRCSMDTISPNLTLQLDMVLRLAGLRLPRTHVGPRFLEVIEAFTNGIGNGPDETIDTLSSRYAEVHQRYYQPFFLEFPHILENLLINAVFRTLFPFGNKAGNAQVTPEMAREFSLLATQFALMKGLLIGIAGHYAEAFSAQHVVHTVQATSKHFEHHPKFLDEAHALLVSSKLDNVYGLTMLLRN
jgi:lysine-N-methylase